MACDPADVRDYYERYGEREWDRFALSPANRVNLHLHTWHLRQFIHPGDRVLDVGAGPGRFTIELARLGARVTVGDLSPAQLALNERKVRQTSSYDLGHMPAPTLASIGAAVAGGSAIERNGAAGFLATRRIDMCPTSCGEV